jgi:CheY-like chemotaxis protein
MARPTPPPSTPPPRCILLVEDDVTVAQVTQAHLTLRGYEVVTMLEPREGLQRFIADPQGFALLITNYQMPGMTGLELAAACRQQRPDLPIILCTGGPAPVEPSAHIDVVLQKPYPYDELAGTIDQLLHRGSTG